MADAPGESALTGPVVVLGASNVTRSISTVVNTAQQTLSEPLEMLIAAGHGRSYGMESWVLGRSLPAILKSGIWGHLERSEKPARHALITDIGNDLIFGATPATICGWVEQCVERLEAHGCQIVITRLPLESILSLSRTRFLLARTMLFPSSQLRYEHALNGSQELDTLVEEMAARRGAATVVPERNWYGIDPIHIRQVWIPGAWKYFFSAFEFPALEKSATPARGFEHLRLKFSCPHERKIFGLRQGRQQPAVRLRSGSRISLY